MLILGWGAVSRSPLKRISPEDGRSNPAIIRRRVDFPHPLGPTIQTNSTSWIWKEMSFRVVTVCGGSEDTFVTFENSRCIHCLPPSFVSLFLPFEKCSSQKDSSK